MPRYIGIAYFKEASEQLSKNVIQYSLSDPWRSEQDNAYQHQRGLEARNLLSAKPKVINIDEWLIREIEGPEKDLESVMSFHDPLTVITSARLGSIETEHEALTMDESTKHTDTCSMFQLFNLEQTSCTSGWESISDNISLDEPVLTNILNDHHLINTKNRLAYELDDLFAKEPVDLEGIVSCDDNFLFSIRNSNNTDQGPHLEQTEESIPVCIPDVISLPDITPLYDVHATLPWHDNAKDNDSELLTVAAPYSMIVNAGPVISNGVIDCISKSVASSTIPAAIKVMKLEQKIELESFRKCDSMACATSAVVSSNIWTSTPTSISMMHNLNRVRLETILPSPEIVDSHSDTLRSMNMFDQVVAESSHNGGSWDVILKAPGIHNTVPPLTTLKLDSSCGQEVEVRQSLVEFCDNTFQTIPHVGLIGESSEIGDPAWNFCSTSESLKDVRQQALKSEGKICSSSDSSSGHTTVTSVEKLSPCTSKRDEPGNGIISCTGSGATTSVTTGDNTMGCSNLFHCPNLFPHRNTKCEIAANNLGNFKHKTVVEQNCWQAFDQTHHQLKTVSSDSIMNLASKRKAFVTNDNSIFERRVVQLPDPGADQISSHASADHEQSCTGITSGMFTRDVPSFLDPSAFAILLNSGGPRSLTSKRKLEPQFSSSCGNLDDGDVAVQAKVRRMPMFAISGPQPWPTSNAP